MTGKINNSPSIRSALLYLYYLQNKKKLSKPESVDIVSIQASVAPLKTAMLSEYDKAEVLKRLNNEARFKG
jgi:hypothetical protein